MIPRLRRSALVLAAALAVPVGTAAQSADPEITADVVYGHKAGMALTFDVIQPSGERNGAAVLYMVSGGWFSRWSPPEQTARRFTGLLDEGFTVFAVRHGSSPRFNVPEAHADVDRALRYIRIHAAEWGVDPGRLGVFGGSAGGHLSLMLGLAPNHGGPAPAEDADRDPDSVITAAEGEDEIAAGSDQVAAVVAYYPPVDLRPLVGPSERFPALNFSPALAEEISPVLFVTPDDPPTLLIHGDADTLVPISNSETLFAEMQEAGVESEFITIPGGDHGFSDAEDRAQATRAMVEWFVEHLED